MDIIYQRGYCNLAATSAVARSEGLFYKRSSKQVYPHMVYFPEYGKSALVSEDSNSPFSNLDEEPLNARGWVCQERLLSTRNISFSKQLVYYECAEELSCEILDSTNATELKLPGGFRFNPIRGDSPLPMSLKYMTSQNALEFWHCMICSYSKAEITEPSDKLVAISGIAKFCQPTFKAEYLAGLWKSNLTQNLCWGPVSSQSAEHVPNYRAPSWSWASMDGGVWFWPFSIYKELVDYVETYTALINRANPYGAVRDSWIRLIGWVFPVFHTGCDSCEAQQERRPGRNENSSFHREFQSSISDALDGVSTTLQIDDHRLDASTPTNPSHLEPTECFFLPIACGKAAKDHPTSAIYCLVLVAMTPSRGVYQRIGLLKLNFGKAEFGFLPNGYKASPEELMECVLPYMKRKLQRCKVPSFDSHTLEKHQITLI